ncbi:hypothetical protein M758_11G011200 [Ceratodon purpureus]|nr:hypothetical protein M758_11G011200 [Ceratodon purpureus]
MQQRTSQVFLGYWTVSFIAYSVPTFLLKLRCSCRSERLNWYILRSRSRL